MNECNHIWCADSHPPEFSYNRQMGPEPLVHVTCERCGARTWFTAKQWCELPDDEDDAEFHRLLVIVSNHLDAALMTFASVSEYAPGVSGTLDQAHEHLEGARDRLRAVLETLSAGTGTERENESQGVIPPGACPDTPEKQG